MSLIDGCVLYFNADNNCNDVVSGYPATTNNISYAPGVINNSVFIDGTYPTNITIQNVKALTSFIQNTGIFSINFWIKTEFFNQVSYVISNTGSFNGFYVEFYSTDVYLFVGHNTGYYFQNAANALTDNNWTMITISANLTEIKVYRNGVLIGTMPPITIFGTGDSLVDLSISSFDGSGNSAKAHYKDEIGFWNRDLSYSEVTQLYNSGNGFSYPFSSANKSNFLLFF